MSGPSILDFARMANAAYDSSDPLIPTYTRIYYGELASGFKAARYTANVGGSSVTIVAFAGTDFDRTDGPADILADVGFAGPGMLSLVSQISPVLGLALFAGQRQLMDQVAGALEFTRQAQFFSGSGNPIFLTGHSLGGGLAQIIGSTLDVRGVSFNAPAVSQMGFSISDPNRFYNVNQARDPVSTRTAAIGHHLGTVINIDNGTNGMDAHLIVPVISYLESGPGGPTGARQLF
ncbi:hypothetical protein ACFOD9_08775 [Novosphingobium bradum]|uniref:Fungal lipase-like domain-containing protein n=1 Tax=Novosphingobium bradum TaxID=1737444 RepID=A0ABV7IRX7_9SPHN